MINYYDRTYKSYEELQPEDIDIRYFKGIVNYLLNPKNWKITDITVFNNPDKFIEYVVYYIDLTYYSEVLPKAEFNSSFTKIKITPPTKPNEQ